MSNATLALPLPAGLVRDLRAARSLLVITGAGMSADSGLPTYRGIGVPIEVALSGEMLRRRPEVAWKHIARIEASCRGAVPHDGHRALVAFEDRIARVCVLTQNVDGLHTDAGSSNVIEIHGNVHGLRCTGCGRAWRVADYAGLSIPPSCEVCHAAVRPEVVLFGEMLPTLAVGALERELAIGFDAVMTIGTSSAFPYIVGPVVAAARRGGLTIEVNPLETELSRVVRFHVPFGARDALVALMRAL